MTKIRIDDLDLSLQTRAGTDAETVDNYAEAMADGARFPEVTVFTDGRTHWLADGFHRVMAARRNGERTVAADVRRGTEDDAVVFGGTANNRQGRRPTRADVQHFLSMVWERRTAIFGGTPTGGNLAERCGVSRATGERFVRSRLAEEAKAPPQPAAPGAPKRPTRLVGANGRTYSVRSGRDAPPEAVQASPAAPRPPVRGGTEASSPAAERPAPPVPATAIPTDRYGTEIPVEIGGAFDNARLADVLSCVGKARAALRRGFKEGDPAFGAVRQDALVSLDAAYGLIAAAKPHCVCRMCQGNGCRACRERGWQTREEHDRNPKEFRGEEGAR